MSAPRIVVTSPWKLGLFVFLLVAACGFGLIYAYYGYFGGRLDFSDTKAVHNFYMICGSVAFLGLLGYLAIVSAAQPADQVAHYGRRRRRLLKKAAGITDPTRVDLEEFQHEPSLAAVLERWREDRRRAEEAEAQLFTPELRGRLQAVSQELEAVRDETNRLAINAALQLSRLGDEAAPLLQTMEQLQEISAQQGKMVVELVAVAGGSPSAELEEEQPQTDSMPEDEGELAPEAAMEFEPPAQETALEEELASALDSPENETASEPSELELASPMAPSPQRSPLAEAPGASTPAMAQGSVEDELAAVHEELFPRTPPAPIPSPVETREEEQVHELSEFGAVELPAAGASAGGPGERVYDLKEFGAVEL